MTKKKPEPKKCSRWPRCHCIVQGYVNYAEPGDCGKKPLSKQAPPVRRSWVEDVLEF